MSRRFGRNQKRKLLSKLADKESELDRMVVSNELDIALRKDMFEKYRNLKTDFEGIVRAIERIANNSSVLPPKDVSDGCTPPNSNLYRMGVLECDAEPFELSPTGPPMMGESWRVVDLWKLHSFIEKNKEKLQTCLHIKYTGNGKESAYMISESALNTMDEYELVRELSKHVIPEMVRLLRRR